MSSCFHLPRAGITGVHYHTKFTQCWGIQTRLCTSWASTLPAVQGPQPRSLQKIIRLCFSRDIKLSPPASSPNSCILGKLKGRSIAPVSCCWPVATAQHRWPFSWFWESLAIREATPEFSALQSLPPFSSSIAVCSGRNHIHTYPAIQCLRAGTWY